MLKYMVRDYCVDCCETRDKARFADALWKRSQLTWLDMKGIGRHKLGTEPIPQFRIDKPMPDVITPDVQLLAFRFSGLKATVGFRVRDVFHIIWLDHNNTLYSHD